MSREWTRRDFLRAAGIGAAGAAILPFFPTSVRAGGGIRRLVLMAHGNGTIIHRWRSNGAGAAFRSGQAIPALVGPILAPLERHRANVTLVDGLDNESGALPRPGRTTRRGAGHNGMATLWSGSRRTEDIEGYGAAETQWAMSATIDQLLGVGSPTRVPVLLASTNARGSDTFDPTGAITSYSGAYHPERPEHDPRVIFDRLFSGAVDADTTTTVRRRAARRSILAEIRGDLGRLRAELPAMDRDRLDAHLAGVDELDRRIAVVSGPCARPERPGETDLTSAARIIERFRLHLDIVQHAFACDLTRVANLLFQNEGTASYWIPPEELPYAPGYNDEHTMSHATFTGPGSAPEVAGTSEDIRRLNVEAMSRMQRALAEEFSQLLDRLAASDLLQDTLAVWGTGMGWGGPHTNWSIPFVLASAHPRFAGGNYHRFGNYDLDIETSVPSNAFEGPTVITPHNRVLTSIMHLMGRTDVEAVGDPSLDGQQGGRDLDNTPISELFT